MLRLRAHSQNESRRRVAGLMSLRISQVAEPTGNIGSQQSDTSNQTQRSGERITTHTPFNP
jgi:hypothetical protein